VAAADLDADRADPAVPGRAGLDPRRAAAAERDRAGEGRRLPPLAQGAGPVDGPPVAVRRVRRAVVRGDLRPAVHFTGRACAPARLPPLQDDQVPAAGRAPETGQASAVRLVP